MTAAGLPEPTPRKLPRWRGFNLLQKFTLRGNSRFREEDFALIRELGFDFVRLPMDYRCWISGEDWNRFDEGALKEVDEAVAFGEKHAVHVCINFHRAPGYCVNPPKEPKDLWTDPEVREICCRHWAEFARRYRGRPNRQLSFDLLNEPSGIENEPYARVATELVNAIRSEDPGRLVISDGTQWGNRAVPELASLGIAQSCRGYIPMQISHHRARWAGSSDDAPVPTWPLEANGVWNRERLRKEQIEPWKKLEAMGVGVHVGEWGAFQYTPHAVVLAWAEDCLKNWQEAGWGWALWNLHGSFGIIDSRRRDVEYEDFRGMKLDRKLLDLLQKY